MLPIPRPSPRMKAGLAVAAAVLLWVPMGISTDTQPVVTGHSTFFNGDVYDQCLASIAGILRSRVMWFNDQILVERYPGRGTFVYVTEHGGKDPVRYQESEGFALLSDGVTYTFVDPNGAVWHVEELYLELGGNAPVPGRSENPFRYGERLTDSALDGFSQKRQYVWVVELSATPYVDEFPGDDGHSLYNFVTLVDTCKFNVNGDTQAPRVYHENASVLNDRHGHPNGDLQHNHSAWNADIYVGKRPTVIPGGVDTYNATRYQSEWTTSESGQQSAMNAGANNAEQAGYTAERRTESDR